MATTLFEQYRPDDFDGIVGQDDAKKTIQLWAKRGLAGRCVFITGASGTGKTTFARVIAKMVADPTAIREVDAGRLTEASIDDEIRHLRPLSLFGELNGRVLIVNEAHRLRQAVVGALLSLMEDNLPSHCLILFTTTSEGLETFQDGQFDAKPFLSRCNKLALSRRGLAEPFALRAAGIARKEGLAPDNMSDEMLLEKCVKLAKANANNLREMLCKIEDGWLLAN